MNTLTVGHSRHLTSGGKAVAQENILLKKQELTVWFTEAFVITDSRMASKIPEGCAVRVVPLISEASIAELQEYVGLIFK